MESKQHINAEFAQYASVRTSVNKETGLRSFWLEYKDEVSGEWRQTAINIEAKKEPMTPAEFAKECGVCVRTVHRLRRANKVKSFKIGHRVRVLPIDVDQETHRRPEPAMSDKKSFPLEVVVSFTSGWGPFCDPHLIDKMLDFITGENSVLLAGRVPDAYKFAKPLIRAEYPELEIAEGPEAAQIAIQLIRESTGKNGPSQDQSDFGITYFKWFNLQPRSYWKFN